MLKDYKGNFCFVNEEYFIVENQHGFDLVHCEDIQQYMFDITNDESLLTEDYEHMKYLLETKYDVYSEIIGG